MKLPKRSAFGSGAQSQTELKRRFMRRMLVRLFVCMAFYIPCHTVLKIGSATDMVILFSLFIAPGVVRDLVGMYRAKGLSKYWAEQREEQEISTMTGKTAEELERMIAWNMKNGRVAEADRLSQRLLSIVEDAGETNANSPASAPNAGAQPGSADASAQETSGGLPDWMREGSGTGPGKVAESEDNKLPDWIKQ